jgi:Domain of unknown function (DUF4920)
MRRALLLVLFSLALTASVAFLPARRYFGQKIKEKNPIVSTQLIQRMGSTDSLYTQVKGPIRGVCQKKGCWMTVDIGNNQTMRVTFKDYGFFVPLESTGNIALMEGFAKRTTTTVAQLRHYAEDAKKSKAEVDAITEDQVAVTFEAVGVILEDAK